MSTDLNPMIPQKGFAKMPEAITSKPIIRVATLRASNNEFRMGKLATQFSRLMAEEIIAMTQSESDGYISVTILYR